MLSGIGYESARASCSVTRLEYYELPHFHFRTRKWNERERELFYFIWRQFQLIFKLMMVVVQSAKICERQSRTLLNGG